MAFKDTLADVVKKNNGRKETARLLGISEGYLSQLLSGDRSPSQPLHEKIIEAMHGRLAFPEDLRGHATRALGGRLVPIVSYVQAGTIAGNYQDLCEQIDEKVVTDCRGENAFAVRVVGDSMEPEAFDGDIAIINPNVEAQSGRPAIVKIRDTEETMIKYFHRVGERGEQVMLGSENPAHDTIFIAAEDLEWSYLVHEIRRQPKTRRAQDFLVRKKTPGQPERSSEKPPASSLRNK